MNTDTYLLYLITFQAQPRLQYFIEPCLVNEIKSGGYGKPILIKKMSEVPETLISENDKSIWEILSSTEHQNSVFPLEGKTGGTLLPLLLKTGRCHFVSHRSAPLSLGKQQQGKLDWVKESDGKQRLHCWVSGGASTILPIQPLWYVDHVKHECGKLELPLDAEVAMYLLFSPPMGQEEIHQIYLLLKEAAVDTKGQEKLRKYLEKLNKPYAETQVDYWYCDWQAVTPQRHWFEFEMGVSLQGERINLLPILAELIQSQLSVHGLQALNKYPDDKIFYAKLPDGKQLAIPMRRLRRILSLLTELYEEETLGGNEKLRLSRLRALQLSSLQEALETKNLQWQGDLTLQTMTEKFLQFQRRSQLNLPKTFQGSLREYQVQGVRWLQFLRELGLSGVLADDMGLGKTVQLLAHLLIEKHKKAKHDPSLIITPTSLIINWQREAQRFTPDLKILILHGQTRKEHYHEICKHDVIITTYALLSRDVEILNKQHYHLLVLDEAQYIKNVHSKAGQVVRKLTAEQRLCLTGTPMENNLGELWALFHFLLPGLLGERRQFQRLFRLPIEKNHDDERRDYLRQRISPFFLRRTKKEVLPELPEKIEMLRPVLLTEAQRELYENVRVVLHEKVLSAIQQQGLQRSQLYILDALLKLRQICCDPRLLKTKDADYDDFASAKLQLLMDLLPNLITQGRRVLLFSQFVSMLELIEQSCQKSKLPYVKLTGQTTQRDEVIQRFQEGEVPLFLISLKAGGVGLNLTAADTVIHYDPWWNPAVENQATDRAHRIGQDKTVFVYKLITTGTIEEKIMALQKEKQQLLDVILSGEHKSVEQFSLNDFEKLFAPLENEEILAA